METKFKHTPGPWHIHFNETGHATSIRSDHHICVMRTNNLDECNANAKLITAAPEMKDVIVDFIELKFMRDRWGLSEEYLLNEKRVFDNVNVVLKKATE